MEEPTRTTSRVELEVREGSEPIKGRVVGVSGTERMFSGWIELSGLLEGLRVGAETGERTGRNADE